MSAIEDSNYNPNDDDLSRSGRYHFVLKRNNKDKVRSQAKQINQHLKQIRNLTTNREDDTVEVVTLPKEDDPSTHKKLVEVYEHADKLRNSEPPSLKTIIKKSKHRKSWLPW